VLVLVTVVVVTVVVGPALPMGPVLTVVGPGGPAPIGVVVVVLPEPPAPLPMTKIVGPQAASPAQAKPASARARVP
jgi:hypothetical protein